MAFKWGKKLFFKRSGYPFGKKSQDPTSHITSIDFEMVHNFKYNKII